MGVAEILLLFVVSVTVVVSLILDSFEKNNKTRHEAEQSSPVLDFESKARIGSFVDKSVNAIDYQDQKQVISDDFKREVFEEIVEEKDGTEYPVREISERSNFCSGVLGISGNMGIIGDDCEREELFDDWEGIERTELEKIFGRAVVFVNNADKFDEDLKLQLYGLQKVALEGPCHESQPMALKVSARSKWNAWEKLGNMSREMAMEKYIEILSMAVPDWKDLSFVGLEFSSASRMARGRGRPRVNARQNAREDEQSSNAVSLGTAPGEQPQPAQHEPAQNPMQQLVTTLQQFMHTMSNNASRGDQPPPHDQVLDHFLRFRRLRFAGKADAREAESWLESIENIFSVLQYNDEQKVNLATFLFDGAARHWWNSIEAKWRQQQIPRTWENFDEEFVDKFIPRLVREGREDEFNRLVQGRLNVAQYDAEFTRLLKYVPHMVNDERRKVRKFMKGLHSEIRYGLMGTTIETYSATVEMSSEIEAELAELQTANKPEKRVHPNSNASQDEGSQAKYSRQQQSSQPHNTVART